MAACTPSIHVFLGRPLFRLSRGIQSIINFGILSSGILFTWPYHCSLFCCIISMMSSFPFPPTISFICSFFILSILDFLADLLSTSISVDKISFVYFNFICFLLWKNMVEPDRPQTTIRRMRLACWITRATDTQSECVTLLAFPLQQWFEECASMLLYTHICLSYFVLKR